MSRTQELIQTRETELERIREAKEELEAMEAALQGAYTIAWGDLPAGYGFILTEPEEGVFKLTLVSYYGRVDYYKLVNRLPNGAQLCHHMPCAGTLKLEKKLHMGRITGILILRAALPDQVRAKLRKANVIQDSYTAGSTYETVVCPGGDVTAGDDIPF